jgi:hypothetical protein
MTGQNKTPDAPFNSLKNFPQSDIRAHKSIVWSYSSIYTSSIKLYTNIYVIILNFIDSVNKIQIINLTA